MKIWNFVHKGLKKLYEEDNAKAVPADAADKLRKMLAFLDDMDDPDELRSLPSWKVHTLTGEGAYIDRRPQGYLEPERHTQSAPDLSY